MNQSRLLLCTDMDRTVIPNGRQPEHPAARRVFNSFCGLPEVTLVYVTGRHRELVTEAIKTYGLPEPDFAVTDVGTKIYRIVAGQWLDMTAWEKVIATDWQGKSREQIQDRLSPIIELTLQEESKQNTFKLSYYVSLGEEKDRILGRVETCLKQLGVHASLIWSIDEQVQVGLLDILPRGATKLHGMLFLQQHLGYQSEQMLFAGDSGNDLAVLGSAVRSVLVANASEDIRSRARELATRNGHSETLYVADQQSGPIGGHYSAGVLQGIWHFAPEFHGQLKQLGYS